MSHLGLFAFVFAFASDGASAAAANSSAAAGSCSTSLIQSMDCYGEDTLNFPGSSVQDCCGSCSADASCSAFSFGDGVCYLKSGCANRRPNSARISGVLFTPGGSCPTSYIQNTDCYGEDVSWGDSTSLTDCCSSCSADSRCSAFSFGDGFCFHKSGCSNRQADGARTSGILSGPTPAPTPPSPQPDSYPVTKGSFQVQGYLCGDRSTSTNIYYPQGAGYFHVVVFGHGVGGGMDCGEDALYKVASTGLIVIAPNTGGGACSSVEDDDMLLALRTARDGGGSLHAALAQADFSRTGVWGYSMGGKAAPTAAHYKKEHNIEAVLLSHGARHSNRIHVPAMFTTGTNDDLEGPRLIKPQFEKTPHWPKVYVSLAGAYHDEPSQAGRLNIWGAYFLSCHINANQQHCYLIYGGALCAAFNYDECIVQANMTSAEMVV